MTPPKRAPRSLARLAAAPLLAVLLAACAGGPAGSPLASAPPTAVASSDVPWLYRGSDVPPDRAWTFGELPNGLRYAVRRNGVPPGQVSIRVRVDAGALNERDDERGYAHLLEHLVFRQSRYLGNGAAIAAWQRLGASFGTDTNAETTPTQTVFKLDLPNANPKSLDETFKLLSGMVTAPTLSETDIRADLPIVLAEMRERGGVASRVDDAMRQAFYDGQPLASRAVIGTVDSLRGADQSKVRAFYHRWYHPASTVVIVAGDADPARLAALVGKWFGGWRGPRAAPPTPGFGVPAAPAGGGDGAAPVGRADVLVEPDLPRNVTYAVVRPWRPHADTIVYNQGLMLDSLAQAVINRRLETRARQGGSYLSATVDQENVSRSVDATFVSMTPLGPDWRAALGDVRAVVADALASPPTQAEIDREAAAIDLAFQVPVEQSALLPATKVADDLVNALDIRETVAAPQDVLRIFRDTTPLFTPDNVLAHTRALFAGTVTRALLVTPVAGEADGATLAAALRAPVTPDGSVRLADKPVRFDTMPAIGKPGEVVAADPAGLFDIEQVTLANGVKALLWPVKDEPGRVAVKVRFGAGYGAFGPDDAAYITLGDLALVSSGEGSLDENELDRVANGRALGFDFDIDDAAFEFSAITRQADLADQLYLFAAKFAKPRWDPNPLMRAKASAGLQYEAYAASPTGVLNRDLKYLQRGRDPRYRTPTPDEIAAATPARFQALWSRALASGPMEVQIYGDFDTTGAIQALRRTLGALPPRALPTPTPTPTPTIAAAQPAGSPAPAPGAQPLVLTHRGDPNQAAAVVSWPTGGGAGGIAESRQLEILSQLFSNRLLGALREKLGASYSPQVTATWPVDLASGGALTALAQLEPANVPVFFTTVDEIAADLARRPPSTDELARVLVPLRQQVLRRASSSAFFMYQLEGATGDPRRLDAVRTVFRDYTQTTPAQMQALAARYLLAGRAWRVAVVPEAKAGAPGAAVAAVAAAAR